MFADTIFFAYVYRYQPPVLRNKWQAIFYSDRYPHALGVTLCEAGRPGMFHAKERSTCQTPTWGGYIEPASWPV